MSIKLYNSGMIKDSIKHTFILCSLGVLLIAGWSIQSFAQDQVQTPNASRAAPTAPPAVSNLSMPPENEEVTILRDNYAGKYNTATLLNLSKLYWRLGAFDFDDGEAVQNFMKINDCKIFTEYMNDDMEWQKILDVMKEHLKKSSGAFPLNFQFLLELHLGKYDPEKGGFPLIENTGFVESKRIEVNSIDKNTEVCFDKDGIKDYPRSVIILLPEAFTLDFVKLDEHVAQAYILRKKSEFSQVPEKDRVYRYERDAYLRLRITFSQYNGNLQGERSDNLAILYGNIDGYEIFEDSAQKRLMASVDLKAEKKAALEHRMSTPAINLQAASQEQESQQQGFSHSMETQGMVPAATGIPLTATPAP